MKKPTDGPQISDHYTWSATYLEAAAKKFREAADLLNEERKLEARECAYVAQGFLAHGKEEAKHALKRTSDLEEEKLGIKW